MCVRLKFVQKLLSELSGLCNIQSDPTFFQANRDESETVDRAKAAQDAQVRAKNDGALVLFSRQPSDV